MLSICLKFILLALSQKGFDSYYAFWALFIVKNAGNFLHGGATATLVDVVGSAVIYTVGAPVVGVSVEINVSYLDVAYAGVSLSFSSYLGKLL